MAETIAHYEIHEQQVGDEVITFKAWDPTIGRHVTIKEPLPHLLSDPAFIESFLEEGRRLANIQDDHVVTLYQTLSPGEVDDKCYLVLEYISQNVDDLLARGPVDVTRSRTILRDALAGLRAIHKAGLIHANVRPTSILVTPEGRAKMTDLRMAWTGKRKGTLSLSAMKYLPPELWQKDGRIGPWSDLYSLGCVAYELFVGGTRLKEEFCTPGDNYHDEQELSSSSYRSWHSDLSLSATPLQRVDKRIDPAVSAVVARLMEKATANRYQDADQALHDLGGDGGMSKTVVVGKGRSDEHTNGKEGGTRVVDVTSGHGTLIKGAIQENPWWQDPLILAGAVLVGLVLMVLIIALS